MPEPPVLALFTAADHRQHQRAAELERRVDQPAGQALLRAAMPLVAAMLSGP